VIESYLSRLKGELRVPRRLRARILDESRDHLLELVAGGMSEEEAVRSFGAPDALAREFHEQLAGRSARRASALSGVLLLVLAVLAVSTPATPADTAIAFFAAQVALVGGVLALARSLRYRGAVPPSALRDIYKANAVTLACTAGVAVSFSGAGVVRAALALATIAAAATLARSIARARRVPAGAPEGDAFDDLLAFAPPRLERPALVVAGWIRRHPWLFCALFAAACGLAVGFGHIVTDGGFSGNALDISRAILLLAAIEGSAVVLGYLALGGVLGIRRSRA